MGETEFRAWTIRWWALATVVSVAVGSLAVAQPAQFVDLGFVAAPAAPPYAAQNIDAQAILPETTPPTTLSVRWARFTLTAPISGDFYLDIAGANYNNVGVTIALYGGTGTLIAADDSDGSFPPGTTPGLSFGSAAERVPWTGPGMGQDGGLAAGEYWLAIVAGSVPTITFGPNWSVSTPTTLEIGFDSGQLFLDTSFILGNTTPPPPPVNNDCANALLVGENVGSTPAWTGTSLGATQDGFSTCYSTTAIFTYKDIWFNYVPSQTGWATMTLAGGPGGAAMPLLTRYETGCGSVQVRCAGGGSFVSPVGTRLTFAVTQGVPVLLAAAVRGGSWGPLTLNINLIGPPCDLQPPALAIPEIETACGEALNDGCAITPTGVDLVQLGESVRGTLWNSRTARDTDHFLLHLPFATTVRVTAAAQLPISIAIRNFTTCPSTGLAAGTVLSYLDGCEPITITGTGVGFYTVSINHAASDDFVCGTGYENYWFTVTDAACDYPLYTSQPSPAQACAGGTATFAAAASSAQPFTWGWEWELVIGSNRLWRPVNNGVFADAQSAAVISGATSPTLTISGVDSAAAVRFRATARTCGAARSRPTTLALRLPAECATCRADFNNDNVVAVQDIFDFLFAYFANLPSADFNNSGTVTLQDIFDFLAAYFAGCP